MCCLSSDIHSHTTEAVQPAARRCSDFPRTRIDEKWWLMKWRKEEPEAAWERLEPPANARGVSVQPIGPGGDAPLASWRTAITRLGAGVAAEPVTALQIGVR
jgi:hypothetical protein